MEDNNMNNITTTEDDAFLPEGWGENDDFFADPNTWTGASQADEPGAAQEPGTGEAVEDMAGDAAPTTEQPAADDAAGEGTDPAPTPGQAGEPAPDKKLKFKARVDREDRDVEMDESELPTVYQKAQNHDRMQKRQSDADFKAQSLGFADVQDMLSRMAEARRESEVKRLTDDGVHEEVARDMVQRRMDTAALPDQRKEQIPEPTRGRETRDYKAEVRQLLEARPELGEDGRSLPDEVIKESALGGKNVLVAYAEYEARQAKAEAESLRRRNEILEQNAAAAAKAPVKGAAGGGPTDTKPEDLFLKGFNSDY